MTRVQVQYNNKNNQTSDERQEGYIDKGLEAIGTVSAGISTAKKITDTVSTAQKICKGIAPAIKMIV
jgi:hypothetical protein